jgi:hypothetical protein
MRLRALARHKYLARGTETDATVLVAINDFPELTTARRSGVAGGLNWRSPVFGAHEPRCAWKYRVPHLFFWNLQCYNLAHGPRRAACASRPAVRNEFRLVHVAGSTLHHEEQR